MLKLNILAVGSKMPSWVEQGFTDYQKRITGHFQAQLQEIPLAKRHKNANPSVLMAQEGQAILNHISPDDFVIALDVQGKSFSTESLAEKLAQWQLANKICCFLIGGPDGLSDSCKQRADFSWSLSELTLPHPLVRLILIEQLYRAISILNNHPYHRAG